MTASNMVAFCSPHKRATRGQTSDRNLAVVEDRRSGKCRKRHDGSHFMLPHLRVPVKSCEE
jgi:hypothetical protein